jgi:hypothetical protein
VGWHNEDFDEDPIVTKHTRIDCSLDCTVVFIGLV